MCITPRLSGTESFPLRGQTPSPRPSPGGKGAKKLDFGVFRTGYPAAYILYPTLTRSAPQVSAFIFQYRPP